MSTDAREALDRHAPPWLFIAAAATILPHAIFQPAWLGIAATALLGWGFWLWQKHRRLPGRWLLLSLVIACCAAILVEYRTLFGRDPGVALLVLLMGLKLLELRSRRDASVIITLGFFLLMAQYFHNQGIATGLWLLACVWLLTAVLIRIAGGPGNPLLANIRLAGTLCLQAAPLMVTLYVLFPRISGPLWGLPQDAFAGRAGLSETMSPGSIAQLVRNGDIAFRVRFDGHIPPKEKLYWRGPVLEGFDGTTWQPQPGAREAPVVEALSPALAYETTLEAHNRTWLLALDAPVNLPTGSALSATLTANHGQPLAVRQRFRLAASLEYRFNREELPRVLRQNLSLPAGGNPRARALAREWQQADATPAAVVGRALTLFNREFTYTLQPPLLGRNSIDEFLFTTRRGFCEHYAGAFVFLMRAAGVPARVVTGYQGGELNPLDGYLVVRQSDAHAWAEVWLAGQGWQRVDPTAAVSPSRIEAGIADALAFDEPLPAFVQLRADWLRGLRYRWEALNNAWNQYLIGYDPLRQRELISHLGFPEANWRTLATLLAAVGSVLAAATAGWILYRRPPRDPVQRLWQKALQRLARRKVHCAPWETPSALCTRVCDHHPELAQPFLRVTEAYLRARYGAGPNQLNTLRDAVARLPR